MRHHHISPTTVNRPATSFLCLSLCWQNLSMCACVCSCGLCGCSCMCIWGGEKACTENQEILGSGPISLKYVIFLFCATAVYCAFYAFMTFLGLQNKSPCRENLKPIGTMRIALHSPVLSVQLTLMQRHHHHHSHHYCHTHRMNCSRAEWTTLGIGLGTVASMIRSYFLCCHKFHKIISGKIISLVNQSVGLDPRNKFNLVREKVLSYHEIDVGVWYQAQFVLSLCQTICTDQKEKSEQHLFCSHPSVTKPTNQHEQPTSGTPHRQCRNP